MCPFCITTAALIAGSLASTGGLAVVAIKVFSTKSTPGNAPETNPFKENRNG